MIKERPGRHLSLKLASVALDGLVLIILPKVWSAIFGLTMLIQELLSMGIIGESYYYGMFKGKCEGLFSMIIGFSKHS